MSCQVFSLLPVALFSSITASFGQEPASPEEPPSSCVLCHGEADLWDGERLRFYVTEGHLAQDIHSQVGLRCHDCHGGDATSTQFATAHSEEAGYVPLKSPADVPEFCGRCHSDVDYMQRFNPTPRTNQLADYWTSGHGRSLKAEGDVNVATCVSCHGGHGMRSVDDVQSPVYPKQLAKTCSNCHSDVDLMQGRNYHGRPMGHGQYAEWSKSVHAHALLENNDLSAATCNDCHGNHGAVPPEVGSVANACGKCHVKASQLFAETKMKHRFKQLELPGCATCHGNHEIKPPTDELLGMEGGTTCVRCHEEGQFGATLAGANAAREMRTKLEKLKLEIREAKDIIDRAKRLGMEVRGPQFDLREAESALLNARTLVHSFALDPVEEVIDKGLTVTSQVTDQGQSALREYTNRRIWLGLSLVPILFVVFLLLAYIRSLTPANIRGEEATAKTVN